LAARIPLVALVAALLAARIALVALVAALLAALIPLVTLVALVGSRAVVRIYFLQHWFNLSDPAVEEALYDSRAMRSFVDVDLGREPVPDETRPSRCRVFGMFMLSHSRVVYWMHDKAAGSPATGIFRSLLDLDPSRYPAGSSYAPMPAAWCRTLTRRAQWSLRSSGFSRKA
jgi:hypothetical protein